MKKRFDILDTKDCSGNWNPIFGQFFSFGSPLYKETPPERVGKKQFKCDFSSGSQLSLKVHNGRRHLPENLHGRVGVHIRL